MERLNVLRETICCSFDGWNFQNSERNGSVWRERWTRSRTVVIYLLEFPLEFFEEFYILHIRIYSIINFISRWDRKPKAFLRFENPKKQWTVIEICFRFKITKHDINLIKFNYYRSQIKSRLMKDQYVSFINNCFHPMHDNLIIVLKSRGGVAIFYENRYHRNVLRPFTIFTIFNVINLQSYYVNETHDYIISIQDHPRIWRKAHHANSNEYIIV